MIPYFTLTSIPLGPISIYVWGLAVAAGILAAIILARRIANKVGLDGEVFFDLAVWILIPAMVFGRIGYVALYNSSLFLNPLSVLRLWDGGMSSFGGYFGAALGAFAFVRQRGIIFRPYAELAAYVLPLGYGIGRIGCFLIHDHPGVLSNFFLAVNFPGGARIDHGLLLSLFGFTLFAIFTVLRRRGWSLGADRWHFMPVLLFTYGLFRLILDFFRAWDLPHSDARYFYLTPSQYGGMLFVALGVYLFVRSRRSNSSVEKD